MKLAWTVVNIVNAPYVIGKCIRRFVLVVVHATTTYIHKIQCGEGLRLKAARYSSARKLAGSVALTAATASGVLHTGCAAAAAAAAVARAAAGC